jgi:endonuclease YncB( thermonuclease family)
VALFVILASPTWAAATNITDADTLKLGDISYRLDGVDAPEPDQVCLDEGGAAWACATEAREQLTAFIANRTVRCDDKGPDPVYPERRIGICWVEGETSSINKWLVREGWALNFEPYAKGRFKRRRDERAREAPRCVEGLLLVTAGPTPLEQNDSQFAWPKLPEQ